MAKQKPIESRVKELVNQKLSAKKIEATLTLEDYPAKDIKAELKAQNLTRTASNFSQRFYDLLIKQEVTEKDLKEMVKKESENVQKHFSHYNRIRETVNSAVKNRK